MRTAVLSTLLAACAARELLDGGAVAGAGEVVTSSRSLPAFTSLVLGHNGCMPLSVRVAEGDYGLDVAAQANVASALSARVQGGTLELSVAAPGFSTTAAVGVTVRVPAGALASLQHGASGNVLVTAPLAPDASLQASGGGWLHVASAPSGPGAVSLSLTGMADLLYCAPSPTAVESLSASLSGTANLHAENLVASTASASLSGMGELSLAGPPAQSATLSLSGSGSVQAAAASADVNLKGMGDIYVSGADAITGSLSGMGHVYYSPAGTSCQLSSFGMGSCAYGQAPPPHLRCGDHSGADVDAANAGGWVVQVVGSQCQVHKPDALQAQLARASAGAGFAALLANARHTLAAYWAAARGGA